MMHQGPTVHAALPGGLWVDGACHRDAALRPVTGADEAFLAEAAAQLMPAEWATEVLARCITRLGPYGPPTAAHLRALTVGDREALLLQLRRATLGDRMDCTVDCPDKPCGQRMDLALEVGDLLLPPYPDPQPAYEEAFREDGATWRVEFRLPTGLDQEEVARSASTAEEGARMLLARCVDGIRVSGRRRNGTGDLPPAVSQRISAAMAERDPQGELLLDLSCPACGRAFASMLDTAQYLRRELTGLSEQLYREVHLLAFHYHWAEQDIMAMTPRRRRRYLELIAEELSAGSRR